MRVTSPIRRPVPGFEEAHRGQRARYPGGRAGAGSRCTPSTSRPTGFDAGHGRRRGETRRWTCSRRHLAPRATWRRSSRLAERPRERRAREGGGASSPGSRSRTCGWTSRTGTACAPSEEDGHVAGAAEAVAGPARGRDAAAPVGAAGEVLRRRRPGPVARTLDGFLTGVIERAGSAARRVRRHLPQGADGGPISASSPTAWRRWRRGWVSAREPCRFEIQVEAPQTVLFLRRGPGPRRSAAGWPRRTSASSTTRRAARPAPARAAAGPPGLRPRPARHADGVRRDRGGAVGRLAGRLPRLRRRQDVRDAVAAPCGAGQALAERTASTRAGTCIPRTWSAATPRSTPSTCPVRGVLPDRVRAWQERREAGGGVMDEPATIKTMAAALRRADLGPRRRLTRRGCPREGRSSVDQGAPVGGPGARRPGRTSEARTALPTWKARTP